MLCWMEEHPTEIAYVIAVNFEQAEYIRKTAMGYAEKIGLDKTHIKIIRNKPEQLRGLPDDAHILRDNVD
jgi:hypothetical protein